METKHLSRITVENNELHEKKVIWEIPYNDATLQDWIHGFVTCMVGITFPYENVLEGLKNYAEDWLDDELSSEYSKENYD